MHELKMAEKYSEMADTVKDTTISSKFIEMAKDEMKHYDFLQTVLEKKETEMKAAGKDVSEELDISYSEMFSEWKDRIAYKISKYTPKR
jgi:rubrerythrin